MKCDQDLCLNFWYDFKKLLCQDELNPRVRCAFGNVFLYFSFFNQVTSIFHLRGGKIKKKFFFWLPRVHGPRPWLWCCFDYFHYDFGWLERTRRLLDLLFQYVPKNNLRIVQQHVLKHTSCIAQKSAVVWICKSVHAQGPSVLIFPQSTCLLPFVHCLFHHLSSYLGHGDYNPVGQGVYM